MNSGVGPVRRLALPRPGSPGAEGQADDDPADHPEDFVCYTHDVVDALRLEGVQPVVAGGGEWRGERGHAVGEALSVAERWVVGVHVVVRGREVELDGIPDVDREAGRFEVELRNRGVLAELDLEIDRLVGFDGFGAVVGADVAESRIDSVALIGGLLHGFGR